MQTATTHTVPDPKEGHMAAFTVSPITANPAFEPGALDGFRAECTCGLVMTSSLRTCLEHDIHAHMAWHERKRAAR